MPDDWAGIAKQIEQRLRGKVRVRCKECGKTKIVDSVKTRGRTSVENDGKEKVVTKCVSVISAALAAS